jgi:hypothetical protein
LTVFADHSALCRIVARREVGGQPVDPGLQGFGERFVVLELFGEAFHAPRPVRLIFLLSRRALIRRFRRLVLLAVPLSGRRSRGWFGRIRWRWRFRAGDNATQVLVRVDLRGLFDVLAPGFFLA